MVIRDAISADIYSLGNQRVQAVNLATVSSSLASRLSPSLAPIACSTARPADTASCIRAVDDCTARDEIKPLDGACLGNETSIYMI